MARSQAELSELLHKTFGDGYHYYFQPPESIKMKYPCFVYSISSGQSNYADNKLYLFYTRYSLAYITKVADDPTNEKIRTLPLCEFDRQYPKNNLYHNIYDLYF